MTKPNPKKEETNKKPAQVEESDPKEEKEQRGILPDDVDFRRGMGCG